MTTAAAQATSKWLWIFSLSILIHLSFLLLISSAHHSDTNALVEIQIIEVASPLPNQTKPRKNNAQKESTPITSRVAPPASSTDSHGETSNPHIKASQTPQHPYFAMLKAEVERELRQKSQTMPHGDWQLHLKIAQDGKIQEEVWTNALAMRLKPGSLKSVPAPPQEWAQPNLEVVIPVKIRVE